MRLECIQLCSAITKGLPGNTLLEISALCPAALLPELQPAPCFPKLINSGVLDLSSHGNNNQTHLN